MQSCLDFIHGQEGEQQALLLCLHQFIGTFPEVTGKIRYRIPFYYRKSWICYLNPLENGAVELAFPRGNELSDAQGLLQAQGRQQVRGIVFENMKDIREEAILEILSEAILLDEEVKYAPKRAKKN